MQCAGENKSFEACSNDNKNIHAENKTRYYLFFSSLLREGRKYPLYHYFWSRSDISVINSTFTLLYLIIFFVQDLNTKMYLFSTFIILLGCRFVL